MMGFKEKLINTICNYFFTTYNIMFCNAIKININKEDYLLSPYLLYFCVAFFI